KYVRCILSQKEPYPIETPRGSRLRYAIGIRDISLYRIKHLNEGELISLPFNSLEEIKKVTLETNQNPLQPSDLADIEYFISPDNGASWSQIQPRNYDLFSEVPEILNFNTVDENSVNTDVPVYSVRLKAKLNRNDENFA